MISTLHLSLKNRPIQFWISFFLVVSLFAVPISSTAKSFGVGIALGGILFTGEYKEDLFNLLKKFWCRSLLLLFLIVLFACIWSPANWQEKLLVIEKYSKLLYLPILAVGFRDKKVRYMGLNAFLIAMAITCFISMLKYFNVIQFGSGYQLTDAGDVFRNHVMTGYMMAFAAFLSGLFFLKNKGLLRIFYGVLTLGFNYQLLFINTGRTGYVIYLLLMVLFVLQQFSWRASICIFLLFFSLFGLSVYKSPILQAEIQNSVKEYQHYDQDRDTRIGYRIQFHEYALSLFKRHPIIGNGTAGFTHLFQAENPVKSWTRRLLEPHSLYWLVAAEFGYLGIMGLICVFASLFMASYQLQEMRSIAFALLFSFLVGNLSDSLLFYSGTGYFFILLMALCLGEQANNMVKAKHNSVEKQC